MRSPPKMLMPCCASSSATYAASSWPPFGVRAADDHVLDQQVRHVAEVELAAVTRVAGSVRALASRRTSRRCRRCAMSLRLLSDERSLDAVLAPAGKADRRVVRHLVEERLQLGGDVARTGAIDAGGRRERCSTERRRWRRRRRGPVVGRRGRLRGRRRRRRGGFVGSVSAVSDAHAGAFDITTVQPFPALDADDHGRVRAAAGVAVGEDRAVDAGEPVAAAGVRSG